MSLPRGRELRWSNLAARWVLHADAVARMTRSASAALVEALAPRPGERLLDLAAGAGDPSHALSARVGRGGLVLASDGVPAMVAACVARARSLADDGGAALRGLVARAEELPLTDASLDGLTCRFGAMFFDDLAASLREARRVLRVGGRAAWLVWGDRDANPYFTAAMEALDAVGAAPAQEEPGAPTVFELSRPGALADTAREAGFDVVREQRVPARMELAAGPEDMLDLQATYSERVEQRLDGLPAEAVDAARRDLAARVAAWATPDGGLSLPAEVVLVTARREG